MDCNDKFVRFTELYCLNIFKTVVLLLKLKCSALLHEYYNLVVCGGVCSNVMPLLRLVQVDDVLLAGGLGAHLQHLHLARRHLAADHPGTPFIDLLLTNNVKDRDPVGSRNEQMNQHQY